MLRSHQSFTMYHVAAGLTDEPSDDGDIAHSGFWCRVWDSEKQEGLSFQKAHLKNTRFPFFLPLALDCPEAGWVGFLSSG